MAGQDIEMNAFKIVGDTQYVYVELADGSQGKIKKSDLAELIRVNMPLVTESNKGLMSNNSIKSFSPMESVSIPSKGYIDIAKVRGLFVLVCQYASINPAIYYASSFGNELKKINESGPAIVTVINGKLRISNPFDVTVEVQYCYQNIGI